MYVVGSPVMGKLIKYCKDSCHPISSRIMAHGKALLDGYCVESFFGYGYGDICQGSDLNHILRLRPRDY